MKSDLPASTREHMALRPGIPGDLAIFFQHQLDPEANFLAAFTAPDPAKRGAFEAHWARILADKSIAVFTILAGGRVAGYIP